ncbi:TssQ family T6SS-associated lipoprotein [Massilia timonae]|uniref:TssQ family T6SS-associated lipoprotein n=1 Tax=Massilia timonae TaxID=47229 RepID=UPI0028D587B1|nr:TssQ family T6SS-associated lipoprotein [Massilia timonae]
MSIVTMSRTAALAALALTAATLVGCAQLGPMFGGQEKARPHPRADGGKPRAQRAQQANRPATPASRRDDVALREGIALYDKGDYDGAIRRLNGGDMNGAGPRERLTALKYTAFSYCVTGRQALCRQTFDRAFRLDPSFDLGPGEHGHPQWGPVFAQAQQAARR